MRRLILIALVCLASPAIAHSQQGLPIEDPLAVMTSRTIALTYTVDLSTVPTRPVLVVEVEPDSAHPDMQLEIEVTEWVGMSSGPGACFGFSDAFVSPVVNGANRLEISLFTCDPRPSFYTPGKTVKVFVRPVDFGATGAPANVSVTIRAITQVPTSTISSVVETDVSLQTVVLSPSKDTVIYERVPTTGSNGLGAYLWAGQDVTLSVLTGQTFRHDLRSLLAFDVVDALPFNALVTDATLSLRAGLVTGGGGGVTLYQVAAPNSGQAWAEGNANADGDEFLAGSASGSAATWLYRTSASSPWATPGADIEGSYLDSLSITSTGSHSFTSAALGAAVQDMVDTGEDWNGFLVTGPGSFFDTQDRGVQFYSSDFAWSFYWPWLSIDYVPAEPYAEGTLNTGVVSFIGEGDDFRWIYDLDQDDILLTDIGGVCEVLPDFPNQPNFLPYTYSYTGSPGYTGVDCCMWQIESPQTGTVGTGQALFYHNLDPGNPAHQPPDFDGDGIKDLCDNCVYRANGPALGSCVAGTTVGATCTSDLECSPGETCQLGQEDADKDSVGDACPVPEPGLAAGMIAGIVLLAAVRRPDLVR